MGKMTFRQVDPAQIRMDAAARKMTFVASDGTRDSAGTVLDPEAWDLRRFNKNGIIGYQHDVYWSSDPDSVIGKGRAYVEDGKLMVDVEFEPEGMNELADKVWKKLVFGTLKAVSVGFMPLGRGHWGEGDEALTGSNPTYYYAGQELLEVSVVNIPANPNALKKSFIEEALEAEQAELRESVDPEPGAEPEPETQPEPEVEQDPAEKEAEEAERRAIELRRLTILAEAASL